MEKTETYLVLDFETTIRCPIGNSKASPFWKNVPNANEIVYGALKYGCVKEGGVYMRLQDNKPYAKVLVGGPETVSRKDKEVKLVVGHNLGFDVHHYLPDDKTQMLYRANWWDTQLAEYLLSAQQTSYASLDYVSTKYGLPVKDSKIKEYWKNGVDTPDIPQDEIVPYALQDVMNTEQVFLHQFKEAMDKNMLPLMKSQMAALKMTTMMSYNGMYINKEVLWKNKEQLRLEKAKYESLFKAVVSVTDYPDCDYGSNKQLATLLFGGKEKYKDKELVGKYKNGNDKYKVVEKERTIEGLRLDCKKEWISDAGNIKVDDDVLQELADKSTSVKCVIALRDINKQISTYYEGIENLIMPDGLIHQQLNHCVTKTGRLSCTQPNLQNITNGDIKQVFTSRFGEDGVIIDIDFSQLEIVALAYLSGDETLAEDIRLGKDIHTELYKTMYSGRMPTKEQRKAFKRLAFGLIYGAGVGTLAKNAGVKEVTAKAFVKTFYERYPFVEKWHKEMASKVAMHRKSSSYKDEDGYPIGVSEIVSCTGRRYLFKEYKLSESVRQWKKATHGFAPTEVKNYFVQGLATGDIVPLALGELGKKFYQQQATRELLEGRCLPVNTVHDSIMFDCKKEAVPDALNIICKVLDKLPELVSGTFGIEFSLPLYYNVSIGPSWADVRELSLLQVENIRTKTETIDQILSKE